MDQFLILKPFIKKLSEGNVFTNFFFWFLRILAALSLIGFLYVSILLWSNIADFDGIPGQFILIAIIAQLLLAALVYAIINIFMTRADDIKVLSTAKDYILTPVTVIFIKMTGEILGSFYAFIGIVTAISIWVLGPMIKQLPLIPGMDLFTGTSGFIGGLIALFGGPVLGFIILGLNYLIAELFQIVVDFLRNTKH